jgi:uncharacterized protein (DUF58 family)
LTKQFCLHGNGRKIIEIISLNKYEIEHEKNNTNRYEYSFMQDSNPINSGQVMTIKINFIQMKNFRDIEYFPEFDNLEFIAKQVVEGFITGLHKSPFHGFSVEFAEHRLYNSGESTKHIDWKLFARTEKLFVKRFEEETNLRGQIVLDISSSMLYPRENKSFNKLNFSIYCASALAYLLRRQRDAVGLSCFDDKIQFHADAKLSSVQVQLIYNQLRTYLNPENIGLNKKTNTAEALHSLAEIMHKRSLVLIFSDMFTHNESENQALFSALQHLKYNKHEVILFHVSDKKHEINFDFSNRPYRFIDMETNSQIKLNPNQIREIYIKKSLEFSKFLELKCGQYGIDLVETDINNDFFDILYAYLLKRSKLG